MRRLTTGLALALLATGLLAGGAEAQQQQQRPRQHRAAQPQATPADSGTAENCGTPDEPKPCPPLPKVNLQYYPNNR